MRRYSIFLAVALVLISGVVGYTLKVRMERARRVHMAPVPAIAPGKDGIAPSGWQYRKDDPQTNKPVVRVDAKSFEGTHDPSSFELHDLALRLYDKSAGSYTYVKSEKALFDEGSGTLKSEGKVYIVMNVPADKDAEDKAEANKRVRVTTSGVIYETKTGKASTDQPASFVFTEGDGEATGAEYDPNTKLLHLKSKVALNWIGHGPLANKMHIETSDLVYHEAEQKIYLSPWSKMQRQSTTIQGQNSVVTLDGGRLHQIDSDRPFGVDNREDRRTEYSAAKMTAMFDEDGNLVQITGTGDARVTSIQPGARTELKGDKADLRFALQVKQQNGETVSDSQLHLAMADGHSQAISTPLPQPGVQLP